MGFMSQWAQWLQQAKLVQKKAQWVPCPDIKFTQIVATSLTQWAQWVPEMQLRATDHWVVTGPAADQWSQAQLGHQWTQACLRGRQKQQTSMHHVGIG